MCEESAITHRCFSRVGLLGNPSDGYYGKVISFGLKNYFAEVSCRLYTACLPAPTRLHHKHPSSSRFQHLSCKLHIGHITVLQVMIARSDIIHIVPHLKHDGYRHDSLTVLSEGVTAQGYTGGLQLILVKLLFSFLAQPALLLHLQVLRRLDECVTPPIEYGHLRSAPQKQSHMISDDAIQLQALPTATPSMQAACNVFWQHCLKNSISLVPTGFTVSYDTNIPRQCGLSGSSAIIIATLRCLVEFYRVTERCSGFPFPPPPQMHLHPLRCTCPIHKGEDILLTLSQLL